jgi:hypothetical protein
MTGPVDVAAVLAEHGDPDYDYRCRVCEPFSLVPWPCLPYRLAEALERAQAASEGVDMLVAQAERRGAVKALRKFRDQFDSFEHDADNATVMAIADEEADDIENGAAL